MIALALTLLLAQAHDHGVLDKQMPKPAAQDIEVGGAKAYAAKPKGKAKGAVLVLHEWWGLNDWIRHQADELAKEGYLALAVDLYKGKVATEPAEAMALMKAFDEASADKVEEAGIEWLKKNAPGVKVATLGWCFGGGQSLRSSLNDAKDVDATVMYYGPPELDPAKLKVLRGPVFGIWGNKDKGIPPGKVDAFDKALTEAGVKHEFHRYDADHAFANPSGGNYNGEAAKDAWEKTRKFLASLFRG